MGQTTELRWAATAASNGAFVLVNDITNCLRIGDLTTMPKGKPGVIHLAEVKRKELITPYSILQKIEKGRALDVQEERLIQAQLALDKKVMPMMDKKIPVIAIEPAMHDAMSGAGAVMKKAMKTGVASGMVTPYMQVEALDMAVLAELKDAAAFESMFDNIPQPQAEPIMKQSSYDRLIRSAGGQVIRSSPPFTIYPWPIKVITKLITGELMMTATIYREPLEEAFRALGWELAIDEKAMEGYESDDDYTKDFTGRTLFPYDNPPSYNAMFLLRNPATEFNMHAGDLIIQMGMEFTTARYAASVAAKLEAMVTSEWLSPAPKYPDLKDTRRWN